MTMLQKHFKQAALSRLDVAAISIAVILSIGCLAKGAVYDSVVALLLLLSLPALYLAASGARTVHTGLKTVGLRFLVGVTLILVLQQLLPSSGGSGDLWQQVQALTAHDAGSFALYDKSAWMQGIGRLLLFISIFTSSLFIGSSESSTRLFLQALLLSGTFCLALTFFIATDNGVPSTTFNSYTHGFVNPNSASGYLGVMLLLAMAQSVRFFKIPVKTFRKIFIYLIDQLNIVAIMKGCLLLFALLLSLAGLFMTGSRGGILLTLACAALFSFIIMMKLQLQPRIRQTIIVATMVVMGGILVWSFTNFGQVALDKLNTSGLNSNSRFDIITAVAPMIADHPLLGVGLGSFPDVFQQYRPTNVSSDGIIDKAHNSYMEFAAEMGIPALLMLLAALGWMGRRLYEGVKQREERYVLPALGLAIWLYAALYSLIDFPLQIPGLAALFIAITTVCVSQTDRQLSEPSQSSTAVRKRVRTRKRRSTKDLV